MKTENLVYVSYLTDTGGHMMARTISCSPEMHWPFGTDWYNSIDQQETKTFTLEQVSKTVLDLNYGPPTRAKNIIDWLETGRVKDFPVSIMDYKTDQVLRTSNVTKRFYNRTYKLGDADYIDDFNYIFKRRLSDLSIQDKRFVLPAHTFPDRIAQALPGCKIVYVDFDPNEIHSCIRSAVNFSHAKDLLADDMYDPYKKYTKQQLFDMGFKQDDIYEDYEMMCDFRDQYQNHSRLTRLDFYAWRYSKNFNIDSDHSRIQTAIDDYLLPMFIKKQKSRLKLKEWLLTNYAENTFVIKLEDFVRGLSEEKYLEVCEFLKITPQYDLVNTLAKKREEHNRVYSNNYEIEGKRLNFHE
ncbi:MAG: hypothetical protein CBD16_02050 [Betaproteobacteria bacterium TMED156]|nr:MAG: hypothetical protein CBD16_02050 [Betaproteobacteria bacterium TMED156]|tara:strand:+ start:500 stop:1561 length:1062 start_codon:yes stop_codon:yes gene_type:complete